MLTWINPISGQRTEEHSLSSESFKSIGDQSIVIAPAMKQKTLRDEFAMHVDIGDIDGYTETFQEAVVGRAKPDYAIDTAGWIRFWNDFEMRLRYLKADSAMKAREVQS